MQSHSLRSTIPGKPQNTLPRSSITCSWLAIIPQFRHRLTLVQQQHHLGNVDSHVARPNKVQVSSIGFVGVALNPEQERNDRDLAEADGEDGNELPDPGPFDAMDNVLGCQIGHVVTSAESDRYGEAGLTDYS